MQEVLYSWMLLQEVVKPFAPDVSKNKMDLHVSGMISTLSCLEAQDCLNDLLNPVIV